MASLALEQLRIGLTEVDALQRANPSPQSGGGLARPQVTRAMGRAEVVLLYAHLERYVYAIHEDMVACLIGQGALAGSLPVVIRLCQSRSPVETLSGTDWMNREPGLRKSALQLGSLWDDNRPVSFLEADSLLAWMTTPSPKSLVRAFRAWGIDDIFLAIAKTPTHRERIRLKLQELVDKRNNIAHGDFTVEATHMDVWSYRRAVREFCERTDTRCSRLVAKMLGEPRPW